MYSNVSYPDDIWSEIFKFLSPSELYRAIQSCQQFYRTAIRELYRHIIYSDILGFMDNLTLWNLAILNPANPADSESASLRNIPKSVTVGHHVGRALAASAFAEHFEEMGSMAYDYGQALLGMNNKFFQLLSSFTSLQHLHFDHCEIPFTLFGYLRGLDTLKRLSFVKCTTTYSTFVDWLKILKSVTPVPFCNYQLAVEELVVWCCIVNARSRSSSASPDLPHIQTFPITADPLCSLSICKPRILRLDWSLHTLSYLDVITSGDGIEWYLGQNLVELELRMSLEVYSPLGGITKRDRLVDFLRRCTGLRVLSVVGLVAPVSFGAERSPEPVQLDHLESFTGPLDLLPFVMFNHNALKQLAFTDHVKTPEEITKSLSSLNLSSLQVLDLVLDSWHPDILQVVQRFPTLYGLKIGYRFRSPSKVWTNLFPFFVCIHTI